MSNYFEIILDRIKSINPVHYKKVQYNLSLFDATHFNSANSFYQKYERFLNQSGKDFSFGIDCYIKMIDDVNAETIHFYRTGKYTSTSYDEVYSRVYNNPEIMEYYMHGLIVSQFIWKQHYESNKFFTDTIEKFIKSTKRYLEIGVGHGLLLSESLKRFSPDTVFDAVDISKTSIEFSKKFIQNSKLNFILADVFDYKPTSNYDFISMGEVLEHVENPQKLLEQVRSLMNPNGILYITTPTNAPAIDHIYLFEDIEHIESIIRNSGFKILNKKVVSTEDRSIEDIKKYKISQHFSAFLKINL